MIELNQTYKFKIKDGNIQNADALSNAPLDIQDKIKDLAIASIPVNKISSKNKFEIVEKLYSENKTIGFNQNWRFTLDKKTYRRKIVEIYFFEKISNSNFIFCYDPIDNIFKFFFLDGVNKIDVTNLFPLEMKNRMFKYFINHSKYRLKIITISKEIDK